MNASEPREDAVAVLTVMRDFYAGSVLNHPEKVVALDAAIAALAAPKEAGVDASWTATLPDGRVVRTTDNINWTEEAAAPQADQQGASLEGEPPRGWGIAGNYGDGKWRCFREGKPQTYLGNPQATRADAMAECHRLAALSKASPDDQRQEGVALPPRRQASDYIADTYGPADLAAIWNACRSETSRLNSASPPTESAAAVGEDWIAGYTQGAHDHADVRLDPVELQDDAQAAYQHALAALSPTASAAREGL